MSGKKSAEERAQHAKEQGKKGGAAQTSNPHNAQHIADTRPDAEPRQKSERSLGSSSGSGRTHPDRVKGGTPAPDNRLN